MSTEERTQERAGGKKQHGNSFFKAAIVLLLLAIVLLLCLRQCSPRPQAGLGELERELTAELGLLPGMSDAEITDRLNRKVAESMLNVSINPMPFFADGKSAGNLRIENIPGNNYSFTVTIVRSDNGETILVTGLIDPGYFVENMKLDTVLPKGEYLCVANFKAYDPESLSEIGETGTQILITVES